jgi:hypothetical protein
MKYKLLFVFLLVSINKIKAQDVIFDSIVTLDIEAVGGIFIPDNSDNTYGTQSILGVSSIFILKKKHRIIFAANYVGHFTAPVGNVIIRDSIIEKRIIGTQVHVDQ